ncbi:MAG: hypothetical protein RL292_309 [Candidatus Parcubacteria bacterium]|jgi:hypothetical protein
MPYEAKKLLEVALLWVAVILVLSFALVVIAPGFLREKLKVSRENFKVRFERTCTSVVRYFESEPMAYRDL